MATTATFQTMLNQYLPVDMLKNELIKRDYLLQRVEHDESWRGGALIVPFQSQAASSIEFGQLADQADISNNKFIRGSIAVQPEAWASLQIFHKDLMQHEGGKIPEQTFLKIMPNFVSDMLNRFRMVLSTHLFATSGAIARVTADGTNAGVLKVSRVDRFELDQKIVLNDDGTAGQKIVYIIGINVNLQSLVVSNSRGGAAVDVSAYTVAHQAKVFNPGSLTMGMTSLGSQLLPASAGGPAQIFGVDKLSSPTTQAIAVDGSDITPSNILTKIFDAYTLRQTLAKSGEIPEAVMSFKHLGNILKQIELTKGAFSVIPSSRKVSVFGWQTIEIGSVNGSVLKLVGIQECPDDIIYMLDWSGITFFSNGLIQRRRAPDGNEYFETRAQSGYAYIVDHVCMGDLVVTNPSKQLVIYNVIYV